MTKQHSNSTTSKIATVKILAPKLGIIVIGIEINRNQKKY